MNQMKIEYLPVAILHPYERNAKKHPDDQVEHIANSIREFGFRQPIVRRLNVRRLNVRRLQSGH